MRKVFKHVISPLDRKEKGDGGYPARDCLYVRVRKDDHNQNISVSRWKGPYTRENSIRLDDAQQARALADLLTQAANSWKR